MCEALRDLFQDELKEQYLTGEQQGIVVTIKNMHKNNFTIDQIALASGKSTDELKEWRVRTKF